MTHQADFYLFLCDINQYGVFLLPLGDVLVYRKNDTSIKLADAYFYLGRQTLCDSVLPVETSLTMTLAEPTTPPIGV